MPDAIVGYTGFVGSNLLSQTHFDECYNSRNIESIVGRSYDLLVCAGAPAEKWRANKQPGPDLQNIERLMNCLSRVAAREMVLISTVDVYPIPTGADEQSAISMEELTPYGKHRLLLEQFAASRFDALIIRLPGLFGRGLKKNIIYDLLHRNQIEEIHADSVFQFYHLDNIWRDIQVARGHELKLVNFATEPTSVREVAQEGFGIRFENKPPKQPVRYDFRSCHAALFGGSGGYLYDKQQVLGALREFVRSETVAC